MYMCVCVYIYIYTCMYVYIYILTKYTGEIKSRISMAKAAFKKKKSLFTSKFDLQ